jgi:4-amino-4-deoxy-L-arabinose transferase-like glycosyltransferase
MKCSKPVVLLPLLFLYFLICAVFVDNNLEYDQSRYAMYAQNLTEGFYAPPDTLFLWNGPGYPLLLAPFVKANIPLMWAKLMNPALLFGVVLFVYYILREYMGHKKSIVGSYILGLYFPAFHPMTLLLTECLSMFLAAGFAFFVVKSFRNGRNHFIWAAGFFCAYLALTKVIFGYVIGCSLVLSLLLLKVSKTWRKMAGIYAISLLFCLPYLIYTYSISGKLFYWANAGGLNIYWMSTPNPKEYGDYRPTQIVLKDDHFKQHRDLYQESAELNYVEQDALFKKRALANIRRHPVKYLRNWMANLGRMWYDYPFTYKYQRPETLFFMVPGSFLLVSIILCIYPLWKRRKNIPSELAVLICFVVIYLGGSSLVHTSVRYVLPIVPILIIIIFYTATKILEIKLTPSAGLGQERTE